jgi:hypothetical protein
MARRAIRQMTSENSAGRASCQISLLYCRRQAVSKKTGYPFCATKSWIPGPDGKPTKLDFDAGTWFRVQQRPVADIFVLARLLERLERRSDIFIIRGIPAPNTDLAQPVRRMKLPDKSAGGKAWFIEGAGQPWVLIDIDKLPVPPGIDPVSDPERAITYLVEHALPPELRDVTFVWQWSSSTGMQGAGLLSAHLWFWLDRPMSETDLKEWYFSNKWVRENETHIDPTLFRLVQPHYTAGPIFDGVRDPLTRRTGVRQGLKHTASLIVPAVAPARTATKPYDKRAINTRDTDATALDFDIISSTRGFDEKLKLLGDGADLQGFHRVITASAASYVSEYGTVFDHTALKGRLREAIREAPKRAGREADTDRYLSDEYLDSAIDTAIERFGDDAVTRIANGPRLIDGVEPTFPAEPLPLEQAKALLSANIAGFFDQTQRLMAARAEQARRLQEALAQELEDFEEARRDADAQTGHKPYARLETMFEPGYSESEDELRRRQELHRIKSRVGACVAKQVKAEFGIESFSRPPRLAVAAAAGIGKTAAVVAEIMKRPELWQRHLWFFVPTIALLARRRTALLK